MCPVTHEKKIMQNMVALYTRPATVVEGTRFLAIAFNTFKAASYLKIAKI